MTTFQAQARPAAGGPRAWRFPTPASTTLPNGLRVLRYDLSGQQLAAADLFVEVPLSAEPREVEGVAALMCRALPEGTEERDASALTDALELEGASFYASTTAEGIEADLDVPVTNLPAALGLLAEAVTRPAFPAAEVDRHVRQRLEELEHNRRVPSNRVGYELTAAVIDEACRLARPAGGTAESVARLDRSAVETFHRQHIAPDRATLLLAGDFAGWDVEALVDGAFGAWQPAAAASTPVPFQAPRPASPARAVVVDRPGAVQTTLRLGGLGPDRHHPDWTALSAAAYVLGGGITSRLDSVLRERKGYTYGTFASFRSYRKGGRVTIGGAIHTDKTGPAVADLLTVLRSFTAEGATAAEWDTAVRYLLGVLPLSMQTARQTADRAARLVAEHLPLAWYDQRQLALRTVAPADGTAAFARHVNPDALTLVAVGDASQIVPGLRDAGFGAAEVMPE
jgi:predicted Zn-dependent peptidase